MSDNKYSTIKALVISTISQIEDLLKKLKDRINIITETNDIIVEDVKPEDIPVDMTVEINSEQDILDEIDNINVDAEEDDDYVDGGIEEYLKTLNYMELDKFNANEKYIPDSYKSETNLTVIRNGSGVHYKITEDQDGTITKLRKKFTINR